MDQKYCQQFYWCLFYSSDQWGKCFLSHRAIFHCNTTSDHWGKLTARLSIDCIDWAAAPYPTLIINWWSVNLLPNIKTIQEWAGKNFASRKAMTVVVRSGLTVTHSFGYYMPSMMVFSSQATILHVRAEIFCAKIICMHTCLSCAWLLYVRICESQWCSQVFGTDTPSYKRSDVFYISCSSYDLENEQMKKTNRYLCPCCLSAQWPEDSGTKKPKVWLQTSTYNAGALWGR